MICNETFRNKEDLMKHWCVLYFCKDCRQCFAEDDEDENIKHKPHIIDVLLKCKDCMFTCDEFENYEYHIKTDHGRDV